LRSCGDGWQARESPHLQQARHRPAWAGRRWVCLGPDEETSIHVAGTLRRAVPSVRTVQSRREVIESDGTKSSPWYSRIEEPRSGGDGIPTGTVGTRCWIGVSIGEFEQRSQHWPHANNSAPLQWKKWLPLPTSVCTLQRAQSMRRPRFRVRTL